MEWASGTIVDEHVWISIWVIESGILGQISIGFVRFFATSIGWL